jgi:hypothetical protein
LQEGRPWLFGDLDASPSFITRTLPFDFYSPSFGFFHWCLLLHSTRPHPLTSSLDYAFPSLAFRLSVIMQRPAAFYLFSLLFAIAFALPSDDVVPESVSSGKRLQQIARQASVNVFSTLDHGSACNKKNIVIRKEWCVDALRKPLAFLLTAIGVICQKKRENPTRMPCCVFKLSHLCTILPTVLDVNLFTMTLWLSILFDPLSFISQFAVSPILWA